MTTLFNNPILDSDSYKYSHFLQYPRFFIGESGQEIEYIKGIAVFRHARQRAHLPCFCFLYPFVLLRKNAIRSARSSGLAMRCIGILVPGI